MGWTILVQPSLSSFPLVWHLWPLQFPLKLGMEDVLLAWGTPNITTVDLLVQISCYDTCISQKTMLNFKGSFRFTMVRFSDLPYDMSTWLTLSGAPVLVKGRITGTSIDRLGSWSWDIGNMTRIDLVPVHHRNIWFCHWSKVLVAEEITYIVPQRK